MIIYLYQKMIQLLNIFIYGSIKYKINNLIPSFAKIPSFLYYSIYSLSSSMPSSSSFSKYIQIINQLQILKSSNISYSIAYSCLQSSTFSSPSTKENQAICLNLIILILSLIILPIQVVSLIQLYNFHNYQKCNINKFYIKIKYLILLTLHSYLIKIQ